MSTPSAMSTVYEPRTNSDLLSIDSQTNQIIATTKEPVPDLIFMPVALAFSVVAALLVVVVMFFLLFSDILIDFAYHPGRG